MKPIDYVIIAVLALIVILIVAYIIRKKLKGEKIGCGCGCRSCPHASACGGAKTTEEKCENPENRDGKEKENDETV